MIGSSATTHTSDTDDEEPPSCAPLLQPILLESASASPPTVLHQQPQPQAQPHHPWPVPLKSSQPVLLLSSTDKPPPLSGDGAGATASTLRSQTLGTTTQELSPLKHTTTAPSHAQWFIPPRRRPPLSSGGGGGGGPPILPPQASRQTTWSSTSPSPRTKLSLRQLMEHSPLESEADTYIQSTLEECGNPTTTTTSTQGLMTIGGGIGAAGKTTPSSILGHVPMDASPEAFGAEWKKQSSAMNASSESNSNVTGNGIKTRPQPKTTTSTNTTAAEDLWQLTLEMQQLSRPAIVNADATGRKQPHSHPQSTPFKDDNAMNVLNGVVGKTSNTSSSLVENAVRIMKRNASIHNNNNNNNITELGSTTFLPLSSTAAAPPTNPTTGASTDFNAMDRWKKLKLAVAVTSTLDAPKKSDGTNPDVEQGGDINNMNYPSNGHAVPEQHKEQNEEEDDDGDPRNRRESSLYQSSVNTAKLHKRRGKFADYKDFEDWVKFKRVGMKTYAKLMFAVMIFATGIAAILFYLAGNPPCNTTGCNVLINSDNTTDTITSIESEALNYFSRASASWWLLFIFCRQVITLSLARGTRSLIIDYFALRSKLSIRLWGPFVTLFIVQSNGWPFLLFSWGIYDFILLFGNSQFAQHWLFYQDAIDMSNAQNPSGGVTSSEEYQTVLIIAVVVSFVVAIKRFWLGLLQGKRTYRRYGEELAKVMKKAIWIGQVASLARDIEDSDLQFDDFTLHVSNEFLEEADADKESNSPRHYHGRQELAKNLISGVDSSSRRAILDELLGAWEEPDTKSRVDEKVNIASIIQFRQSLTYLDESFPFGVAFGPAASRQECIESAEKVYARLMLSVPLKACLSFDVLALLTVSKQGDIDEEKLKDLIKLFRPDREGNLSLLDFAKSVDMVYKELRLLRASVANASKLEKAFESIFNVIFYIILVCIIVATMGLDPLTLFASISGFVLGFAFMIGAACSKYFEGLLLIFVRRPYDIGDRIALSNPFSDTISTGSQSWVVKDIDLYTTTVVLGATNEVSTISNGSIAGLRIINCARSPKATLSFLLKFPIDTSYTKLQIFKSAIEKFIKARPREWISFLSFRATRVEADLGFVEYIVNAQHRESWQNLAALLESKAQLSSFGLELSKKMDMRYSSPSMPIDLNIHPRDLAAASLQIPAPDVIEGNVNETGHYRGDSVAESVAAMFGTKLSPMKMD